MTIRLAKRNEPANNSATIEGPDGFPLSRELKTSAAKIVSDRRRGAARTSKPDFSVSPATYVATRIPAAISRLGVRLCQYLGGMLVLLYFHGVTNPWSYEQVEKFAQLSAERSRLVCLVEYGFLFFMTSKLYQY
jgi:hypothetical protein